MECPITLKVCGYSKLFHFPSGSNQGKTLVVAQAIEPSEALMISFLQTTYFNNAGSGCIIFSVTFTLLKQIMFDLNFFGKTDEYFCRFPIFHGVKTFFSQTISDIRQLFQPLQLDAIQISAITKHP